MWCCEGLECLINLTQGEQENIVAILRGEAPVHRNPLQYMILRAQANMQRYYEIYVFETDIPEVSLREIFEETPQVIVESIRRTGVKIYSARRTQKDLIT